ncbi:hypothetical protein OG209_05330 [Streptomyces sp. NBC_01383]
MFGSADLSIADQATKRSIQRTRQAAEQAEAARIKRESAEKAQTR